MKKQTVIYVPNIRRYVNKYGRIEFKDLGYYLPFTDNKVIIKKNKKLIKK